MSSPKNHEYHQQSSLANRNQNLAPRPERPLNKTTQASTTSTCSPIESPTFASTLSTLTFTPIEPLTFASNKPQNIAATSFALGCLAMSLFGQFLRSCAMVTAKTSFNHIIVSHKDPSHTLITHGIYNYERHPSYVGFFFWATGLQIMIHNPISFIVYALVLGKFFIDRVCYEEHTLIRLFGSDYIMYKKNVPTLIPSLNSI
ncbi:hypothetical protein BB561_001190 [Smittium simulii]|uniref:Protein-S-isoprenylcysteine O-methyltransferase n=1 Tax=Smittium simulii TaxID=133385 RepID=A0A2T9YVP2_9FUNG|nr:hypothetical protein BB561_001190 [Smittium simulii]